jgi:hypothetical protein
MHVVDAKNARVAGWYAGYGAVPLLDAPLSLVLPLATIEARSKKPGTSPYFQPDIWHASSARLAGVLATCQNLPFLEKKKTRAGVVAVAVVAPRVSASVHYLSRDSL